MSRFVIKKIMGTETRVAVPDDAENMLVTQYTPIPELVRKAEEDFIEKKNEYFTHTLAEQDALLKASNAWERAGRILAGMARSAFHTRESNAEQRKYALSMLELVAEAANLRWGSLIKLAERNIAADPKDETTVEKMEKLKYHAYASLTSAINTWAKYLKLHKKGIDYVSPKMEREIWAAREYEKERKLIPEGRIWIPGRIYPPIPVPWGEPVPEPPLAYQLEKMTPAEFKVYDPELDELVLKPGYVSPDGLIDDQSVIRDRANHRVIMKLRGGEPVIWPEWKAAWTGDVMEPGSWPEQYYVRLGWQIQQAEAEGEQLFTNDPADEEIFDLKNQQQAE